VLAWVTSSLAALAAVTGAIGALGNTAAAISAFLGLSVPILLAGSQSWRAATRDTDKATAYRKAHRELQDLRLELTDVEGKANIADVAAVRAYFDRVRERKRHLGTC
jgi:hypothetical protein